MFKDRRHMIEFGVGIAVILSMLLFGILYNTEKAYANLGRLLVGGLIGYALARSAFGFAGTVNRACQTGSTKLNRFNKINESSISSFLIRWSCYLRYGPWWIWR